MNIYQKLSEGNFPDFGSTCHVIRTHGDKQEEFFGRAKNAYGVPAWQTAQGIIVDAMPSDQWKLVEFKASPKTQAEPPADQPERPTVISMPFSPRGYSEIVIGDVTVRQYNDGRTEALYNGKVMIKDSTEALTLVCNEAQSPADTEKIKFRVEDGMLVGENTDAEWCVATPVSEAYDVLIANASRFDTDPNSLEERNKRQQEVIEVQVEELTKYRAALKAKEEEREAFLKVLATKDAKITDLMVQNATLKARLNPNAEA